MDGAFKTLYIPQNTALADSHRQDTFFDRGNTRNPFKQFLLATYSNTPERQQPLRM